MTGNSSLDPGAPQRPTGPRLYHRKSRTGCLRCKARRVKCDEDRPSCGGCSRHLVECVYPNADADGNSRAHARSSRSSTRGAAQGLAHTPNGVSPAASSGTHESNPDSRSESMGMAISPPEGSQHGASTPASARAHTAHGGEMETDAPVPEGSVSDSSTHQPGSVDVLDLPETRDRRITEMQLLHHYLLHQAKTFRRSLVPEEYFTQPNPNEYLWSVETVNMAFENDCILYGLLAHSALSQWIEYVEAGDERAEHYRNLQQQYLAMALREQRRAVAQLSSERTDHVVISSLQLLNHVFALVQTVPASPWEPPAEFMQMGRGVGQVFMVARGHLGANTGRGGHGDRMTRFLNTPPRFDPDEIFDPKYRAHLEWVLDRPEGLAEAADREMEDKVTRHFYLRTLSYVGWCEAAVRSGTEPDVLVCRRFAAFAVWAPEILADFMAQRRPRALVVMAYFFALWIPYEHLWMIRTTGARQVRGIYEALPPEWRAKLDPLFVEYKL
ncbi:uncharacterized protein E0L32_009131 [Thyridium curvatum]|uniref:Zn(2)-C6 fungal-type domain-containing protein n=1 Tax=Thyridium curvatum TaxID=1093900 RepID=A0A507AXW9_9PEZI|nr:uncharacterized protein E0L32_009131 [Thyridium curvatum]TPX09658.1 hypothetical protein E0L32_009131 [Thyridium curvatum]